MREREEGWMWYKNLLNREIDVGVFPLGKMVIQVTPICSCLCDDYVSLMTFTIVSHVISHDRR